MSGKTTRWWWIRHAPVDNPDRVIYGHNPVRANVSDRARFADLAQAMPEPAVWLLTTLIRTHDTASALAEALIEAGRCAPALDQEEAALAEQDFGDWTGLSHGEINRRFPTERFWLAPAHERPQNGESFADVMARVAPAVNRLSDRHAGQDIVAVAHGGTIRAALGHALDLPPEKALRFQVHNLSLTRIDCIVPTADAADSDRLWRVVAVNVQPSEALARL